MESKTSRPDMDTKFNPEVSGLAEETDEFDYEEELKSRLCDAYQLLEDAQQHLELCRRLDMFGPKQECALTILDAFLDRVVERCSI